MRLLVLDVDGVLTDGRLYLGEEGSELRAFHVQDGLGLVMLRDSNVPVAAISGRASRIVPKRLAEVGVEHCYMERTDKLRAMEELLAIYDLPFERVAYMGDDVIDVPVIRAVGLGVAVADAHPAARRWADWVTTARGGRGAVREVCEAILEARGLLRPLLDRWQAGMPDD